MKLKLKDIKVKPRSPHIIVKARAGTGKSTTINQAVRKVKGLDPRILPSGIEITPTPQQEEIWETINDNSKYETICVTAFNNAIAKHLSKIVPKGVKAKTIHGLGFGAILRSVESVSNTPADDRVVPYKTSELVSQVIGIDLRSLRKNKPSLLATLTKLVSLCKKHMYEGSEEEVKNLVGHYDLDQDKITKEVTDLLPEIMVRCLQIDLDGFIDYDDMVWLPLVLDLDMYKFDLVLVDEAQDLNYCQRTMIKNSVNDSGRLVFVGDERQAIYGFAGATSDSLTVIEEEMNETKRGCIVLPLTVTRRCGKAIVERAKSFCPDFEAHDDNPEGAVLYAPYSPVMVEDGDDSRRVSYLDMVRYGDMVLCRNNAPLVKTCFNLISRDIKANIAGKEIGSRLIELIEKLMSDYVEPPPLKFDDDTMVEGAVLDNGNDEIALNSDGVETLRSSSVESTTTNLPKSVRERSPDILHLIQSITDWYRLEVEKEMADRHPSYTKMSAMHDKKMCIMTFTSSCKSVREIIERIESIFSEDEDVDGVHLSTIHKAKGLEASRVFIIDPPDMYTKPVDKMQEWEMQQEENLKYVSITRAIDVLVYATDNEPHTENFFIF